MTAELLAGQFIEAVRDICRNAENCDMCELNSATNGVCMIDKMDAEKLILAVKKVR